MNPIDLLEAHRIVLTGLVLWVAFNGLAARWLARLKGGAASPPTLASIDGISVPIALRAHS